MEREAYGERIVVARLLDSTNAAGQRLPYMANISHHVTSGPAHRRHPEFLDSKYSCLLFELDINRLSGPTQGPQSLSITQSDLVPPGPSRCDPEGR